MKIKINFCCHLCIENADLLNLRAATATFSILSFTLSQKRSYRIVVPNYNSFGCICFFRVMRKKNKLEFITKRTKHKTILKMNSTTHTSLYTIKTHVYCTTTNQLLELLACNDYCTHLRNLEL